MLDSVLASWDKMTTPTADGDRIIAAIDLGTNSLHMVVVEIEPKLPSFSIIGKEKETVRLGNREPETGNLKLEVMERAIHALARFQEIAKTLNAEAIIAVATSAIREAPNGRDFLERVKKELGLDVDLISGQEEARRIYLGVLSGMEFAEQPHIIIDIGGGSTELILCDSQEEKVLTSTKVGAVRLSKEFITTDPISTSEFDYLQAYTRGKLERAADEIKVNLKNGTYPCLVGTSGTIETIAAIDVRNKLGVEPSTLNGYEFTFSDLQTWIHRFRKMDNKERAEIPGMPDRRSEVILGGAIVLQEAMALLNVGSIKICERALREGVIVDWMLKNGFIENRLRYQSSVRERNIVKAAQKFQVNTEHSDRIAEFALSLFDQTQYTLHDWDSKARELLWAAAILHNCGYYVSHSAHHKHSYYLIRNSELLGYNETEIEIIANLARYHRKSAPKKKHENYRNLIHKEHRELVSQLSSLLRIATALDKRQNGAIAKVECTYDSAKREFQVQLFPSDINDDCALELWSLDYSKVVFEEEFNVKLVAKLGSSATVTT
ncbi:Ppx/GppA phosphatase family protein [Mastigocoleus sp. MO_188.B34]|uniref:Ppx/GppA phosphatase family protein n=1 Tax=Mastigocoleus sp. MO_188.B34 TaxID=3036635 RepID=UPI0026289514|nr:Ppx/GppA phosphatase family protein [Mastigocoleus sp. MO_188.B34]MDJ0696882.1 Ppx/GppA phosphatase family protein [Mastigocoleus sp. MO_188.B34]